MFRSIAERSRRGRLCFCYNIKLEANIKTYSLRKMFCTSLLEGSYLVIVGNYAYNRIGLVIEAFRYRPYKRLDSEDLMKYKPPSFSISFPTRILCRGSSMSIMNFLLANGLGRCSQCLRFNADLSGFIASIFIVIFHVLKSEM